MYDKIFPPKKWQLDNGKVIYEKRSRAPFVTVLVIIAIILSARITNFDLSMLIDNIGNFLLSLLR